MLTRSVLTALIALASASVASAQVPAGTEFVVNSYTTSGQQRPGLAMDAAGNMVIAWISMGQDGDGWGVFGQRLDGVGNRLGAEFQVNTTTTNHQASYFRRIVGSDEDGNFVVAWAGSFGQDGDFYGVFARRYDAAGNPRGGEFQVNVYTTLSQTLPALAVGPRGDFVVVWESYRQDGYSGGVFGRRFDAAGSPVGDEFQVNTYTTLRQYLVDVDMNSTGAFVVVWNDSDQDGSQPGIFAQRFDSSGARIGGEFRVNSYTTDLQRVPVVATNEDGSFVVTWLAYSMDGSSSAVAARRFDGAGNPVGEEFVVNGYTSGRQAYPFVDSDARGNFVITWVSYHDDHLGGVFGRRFGSTGSPRGGEFHVNSYTTGFQIFSAVGCDRYGNFVVTWESVGPDGDYFGAVAQRFGGLRPAAVGVDTPGGGGANGNNVLEPGEAVDIRPAWRNVNGAAQTFGAGLIGFAGPAASGVTYEIHDGAGGYGTVANGATAACSDCYHVGVTFGGTRPSVHWDAVLEEKISPDVHGQQAEWRLHVGASFTDVPTSNVFYRFIETLLHHGVTGGCTAAAYCPTTSTTRDQMAVFVLVAKERAGYAPPACMAGSEAFADVPASSPFCRWIEELARRGVVGGCGGGNYCPSSPATRDQMAVFVLRTLDPALVPPACVAGSEAFADVPFDSPFCRWVEELARRGVVAGCGGGNYCPTAPVTRDQMGVFISVTFGLTLYGP